MFEMLHLVEFLRNVTTRKKTYNMTVMADTVNESFKENTEQFDDTSDRANLIFPSGKESMQLGIEMMKYKVVFLDINMEEVDGLDTARWIRQYSEDMFIVFVTAYITYALEGYKFNAVRFVLKETKMFSEALLECMDEILEKMNYVTVKKDISFCEGRKEIRLDRLLFIEQIT